MKRFIFMALAGVFVSTALYASEGMNMPIKPASPEFARIKALAGTWKGTTTTGDKTEPASVEYKVTSGGNAVLETLFPGTPHEMVSVYQDGVNGKLKMTHYCMLPNTPVLNLKSATDQSIVLDLSADSGTTANEQHMHGLALSFAGPNELTQTWTCYENGAAGHSTVIRVKRA